MASSFLCHNCGSEASLEFSECPHCGVDFNQIYCSRCHYRAEEDEFFDGCPRCGYMSRTWKKKMETMSHGTMGKPRGKPRARENRSHIAGGPSVQVLIFAVITALGAFLLLALLWLYDRLP